MSHWLLGNDSLLGSLLDQLFKLLAMNNTLLQFFRLFKLLEICCLVYLRFHIVIALFSVNIGHLSRLIKLVAHLHLVVELISSRHFALKVLLLSRLADVLFCFKLDIVVV